MTLVVKINKEDFFALLNGQEISLERNEPKEYGVTFPAKDDPIKIRYDNTDHVGVLTQRIDTSKDDGGVLINYRIKLNQ